MRRPIPRIRRSRGSARTAILFEEALNVGGAARLGKVPTRAPDALRRSSGAHSEWTQRICRLGVDRHGRHVTTVIAFGVLTRGWFRHLMTVRAELIGTRHMHRLQRAEPQCL